MESTRKKVSEVWNFFKEIDGNVASCNLCRAKLSYKGSSSNLKKHINRKHPTVQFPPKANAIDDSNADEELVDEPSTPMAITDKTPVIIIDSEQTPNSSNAPDCNPGPPIFHSNSLKRKQTTMTSFIPKKMSHNEKSKIDHAILKMFAWDFQPFLMVEDRGFKNLIKLLAPNYTIPSRKYFTNTLLPALYAETKNNLKDKLKREAPSLCITADSWTSATYDSYVAITGHYIDPNFQLQTILLDCEQFEVSHTSKNLADFIQKVLNEWDITQKIIMVVTDNAYNIKNAIISCLSLNHFGCYAHKLNLIVQDALSLIDGFLNKIKKIVTHFKRSGNAMQVLIRYQSQLGEKQPKKLLQDVPTRWNSTFFMLERFLLLEEAVKHSLALVEHDLEMLTPTEWQVCRELCCLLEPFAEVTKELSTEKYVNGSKIIPITLGLIGAVNTIKETIREQESILMATSLLEGIVKRLSDLESIKSLALCTLLDPRYKQHMFEKKSTVETIKNHLVGLVKGLICQAQSDDNQEHEPMEVANAEHANKKVSVWDVYEETMKKVKPSGTATSKAIIEVQRYLDEHPIAKTQDPMQWWKDRECLYPNLSKVVRSRCNILATSVPCERVFSKAGYMISDRRTRLTSMKIKSLVSLNMNLK